MKIKKLSNQHKEVAQNFLKNYVYSSMFLLGNINQAGLEYTGERFSGEYWAAFDETDEMRGILAHFWNGNLMAQAPDQTALQALTDHFLKEVSRPIAGMIGESKATNHVLQKLNLPAASFSANRSEDLYQLHLNDLKLPASALNGELKIILAAEAKADLLFEWFKNYELEALGSISSENHDEHIHNRVRQAQETKDIWVLLRNGEPVALSGFNSRLPEIVQVGPVWTPPEYRNQGYARTLLAFTLQKEKQEGLQKSVLFTDSPAAAKAYEAIGYKKNGSFHLALLKEPVDLSLNANLM